jgi:DNA repair/transcription protein MET18/MMS19
LALIHLARHAPIAAVLQSGDAILPLLPEAMSALSETASKSAASVSRPDSTSESAAFADRDALAAAIMLTAAFLADPRGRDALARHAEKHAGAIVDALCRLGSAGEVNPKLYTLNPKTLRPYTLARKP